MPLDIASDKLAFKTVTISNGSTTSEAIDLGVYTFKGLTLPASFDGSNISFESSDSLAGTYSPIYNYLGALYTIPVAAGRSFRWEDRDFEAERFIRIVSDSTESSDRTITLRFINN